MNLKQVVVGNQGMSQDLSISKQNNKFAFENKNLRIQATDDGTLLSVTNLRNPKEIISSIEGIVLGHCVTPDYLVIFAKKEDSLDIIYRIDLGEIDNSNNIVKTLYRGNLDFSISSYFDTLYYEEGENVKKVYWTDGKNNPRVINLVTRGERHGGDTFTEYTSNEFEFYPNVFQTSNTGEEIVVPEIKVTKNRNVTSELPSGVIQYFVSYFWENGAETLIANASDLYTIDYSTRGAKADELGMCAFDLSIPSSTVNHAFDYIRIYSAIRTTYNGPLIVKIVGDIKLDHSDTHPEYYTILDDGVTQEQLPDSSIYFLGGTPFIAKTLIDKDETLFFGGIKQISPRINDDLKGVIDNYIRTNNPSDPEDKNIKWWANGSLRFTEKKIFNSPNQFNAFYNYKLQLDSGDKDYRTFKAGEIYRFGIQFQDNQGSWSDVYWIGDKECIKRPSYDEASNSFIVNGASFKMPNAVKDAAIALGFKNYRIVIADAEKANGRKIKAQGILCPTLFTPGQRAMNAPYILPSWSMRTRKGKAAYHHMEPLFSAEVEGSEIASYCPDFSSNKLERTYTSPFYDEGKVDPRPAYVVTYLGCSPGSEIWVRSVLIHSDYMANNFYDEDGNSPAVEDYKVLCDYIYDGGGRGASNSKYADGIYGEYNESKFKYVYGYGDEDYLAASNNFVSLKEAYEYAGVDVRLIPDPNTFKAWGKDLVNQYALSIAATILTVLESSITFGMVLAGGSAAMLAVDSEIAAGNTPPSSILYTVAGVQAAGTGVMSAALDIVAGKSSERNTPTKIALTDNDYISLLGSEQYDKLAEYQKSLWKKRCMPLYTTHAQVKPAGGGSTYRGINAVVFKPTKQTYNVGASAYTTLPEIFCPKTVGYNTATTRGNASGYWDQFSVYMQVIPVALNTVYNQEIKNKYYDYFIDESWVTFNSPELETTKLNNEKTNLRIVGTIPYSNSYSDFQFQLNASVGKNAGLNYQKLQEYKDASVFNPLYSDYLYYDYGWINTTETVDDVTTEIEQIDLTRPSWYKTFLFGQDNYLGATSLGDFDESLHLTTVPGKVIKQQALSHKFSAFTNYNLANQIQYKNIEAAQVFEGNDSTFIRDSGGYDAYANNYDTLVVKNDLPHFFIPITEEVADSNASFHQSPTSTRIKFSSTPHVLLNLNSETVGERNLLPRFDGLSEGDETTQTVIYEVHTNIGIAKWDTGAQKYFSSSPFPGAWGRGYVAGQSDLRLQAIYHDGYNSEPGAVNPFQDDPDSEEYAAWNNGVAAQGESENTNYYHNYTENQESNPFFRLEWSVGYRAGWKNQIGVRIKLWPDNALSIIELDSDPGQYEVISVIANEGTTDPEDPSLPDIQYFRVVLSLENSEDSYNSSFDRKVNVWEDDTHRGEWQQNNYTNYDVVGRQLGVWQNGLPYNCGDYFVAASKSALDISGDLGVAFLQSKLTSAAFYSTLLNHAYASEIIDNQGAWTGWNNDQITLSLVHSGCPNVIIGEYEVDGTDCYQTKRHLKTITVFRTSSDLSIPDGVVSVEWDNNYTAKEDDIYLNEFDVISPRVVFKTYTQNRPRKLETEEYALEWAKDFAIKYTHPVIHGVEPTAEYSFIGELYQDIKHKDLYGGYDDHDLRLLSWYPISPTTPLGKDIDNMGGDTYYQRWDCLKTYPTTEEDVNQYVDITSFMVESHINLDSRSDVNRATFNIMSRPTNFNLFNTVYNQPNNIFEYTTEWNDLPSSLLSNYIVWSTSKNLYGDVDSWTNVNLNSSTRTKYPVTKLTNFNNQVLALTEHSIEVVNFNAKQLVPTTDNSFIELQNSSKVDGTTKLQYPYGTYNMSTLVTEQGLYFIDDNEKSLIRLGGDAGVTKIGYINLTDWLHNNIIQGTYTSANREPFHLEYDAVHKDLYLINKDVCLVYNESLNNFTSLITYTGEYWLFNYGGKTFAYRCKNSSGLYEMFAGDAYNQDFDGTDMEYSVWYRINPGEYTDKVFTNGIIMADCGTTGTNSNLKPNSTKASGVGEGGILPPWTTIGQDIKNGNLPFDTIRAWTEYQDTGDVPLVDVLDTPSTLKQKFRFWRFNIPRHNDIASGGFKRDRIRNPWIHLKLDGRSTKKMEFHNMSIQYME